MYELRSADLHWQIGSGNSLDVLRGQGDALLCVSRPSRLRSGESEPQVIDPVLASGISLDSTPCIAHERGVEWVALQGRSAALRAVISRLQQSECLVYLPPALQLGLHWLQRETRARGGLAQSHVVALSALASGWLQALPRLHGARWGQDPGAHSARRTVARLRAQLSEAYAESVTLDQWAARLSVSRAQLNRALRQCAGLSINRYRRELRLRCAAAALLDGRGACAEVARRHGYASASQFSLDFRGLYGVPPSRCVALIDTMVGVAAPE